MCTVSYIPTGPDSFVLASNRDEITTRKKAKVPGIQSSNGVKCIWPVDGKAGGTWIAVNEFGCAFTLMNDYQSDIPERNNLKSRGIIIPDIAGSKSPQQVSERLAALHKLPFAPFRLLMVDARNGVTIWHYNGKTLQEKNEGFGAGLWVSAGKHEAQVLDRRRMVFEDFLEKDFDDNVMRLKALHTSKLPEPGPYAISMEYEHVQTVSATIIDVHPGEAIRTHYMPGLPSPQKKWQICEL